MRVLYFSPRYTVHDRRFLQKMLEAGEQVLFLSLAPGLGDKVSGDLPGVCPLDWSSPGCLDAGPCDVGRCLSAATAFRRVVRDARPDLVQAGPVLSCGFVAALSQFHPLFLVSWGHDILMDVDESALARSMASHALDVADRVVCDCDAVRLKAMALAGVPEDRFVQFPWGVDLAAFEPSPPPHPCRVERGWERSFVWVSARSWEPRYGIETLIRGFADAWRRNPGLRLLLLGDGSARDTVKALVRNEGLGDVIHMAGSVPEARMLGYLAAADAYVSCSKTDGSSVTLLQAMAVGLPVVVSDIPGNREWVGPGNGLLFAVDDVAGLSASLLRVAGMAHRERHGLGEANRALVRARADWNRNVEKLIASHRAAVQRRP